MLRYLRISNLAVISDVEIECDAGLNLLTGETGSGKSIIVDALSLLLGARGSQDLIRTGESHASVEGVFQLPVGAAGPGCLSRAGIEVGGSGELFIRRVLQRGGPTRAFVNDHLVTASLLRELRPSLIDIHGQGDHQSLLFPSAQRRFLDALAGVSDLRQQLSQVVKRYQQTKRELDELSRSEAERWRLMDVYRYQIADIERCQLRPGEDEELERQRRVMQQAEKLARLTSEAYDRLYEADDSMLALAARVRQGVQELIGIDDRFAQVAENLDRARLALEESAYFLRDYLDGVDCSPEALQQVEDRLAQVQRLKRKYGPGIDDVLGRLEQMKKELDRLSHCQEARQGLEQELAGIESEYHRLARRLTEKRTAAARQLEQAVAQEMRDLAMEQGRLLVALLPVKRLPAEAGAERVEFLVSMNPGEELKPLSRVASGGELSRLMLAIKSVAAADSGPLALVFDEIDVGIGGQVAERVGQRLKRLARSHQVFCVTHLPQIARFADAHFRVEKRVVAGRAIVRVERLDRAGRVNELARMMAGAQVTDVSRRHARELLQAAQ